MNTNSLQQQQILGGHETNAEMWNSPYSDTGSTDGTVAGNSINGSLDRTANYVDSYLEADKPVEKLRKQGGLALLAFAGVATGMALLIDSRNVVKGALGSGGFGVVIAVIALLATASLIIGAFKMYKAKKVAEITTQQEKELEKQARQNITLAATNREKEFKYKQQMAEENLKTTASINEVKNQSRRTAANTALLQQNLNYANLGSNMATAMDSFNEIDESTIKDAQKKLYNVKLFSLDSAKIDKGVVAPIG